MEKNTEEPRENRSIFWYGAIGIGILGIPIWILIKIITIIYTVGDAIGIGWILQKYFWAYIPFSHPFLQAPAIFAVTLFFTIALIYLIGLIFSKQVRNETLIKKIFIHLPLFKRVWKFFEDIYETIHAVKNSPFVMLKDYPSHGFRALGIVTGKQIFDDGGIYRYAKPCVFVMYSMFLPNGPIVYPDRDKIEKISTGPSLMIKLMVTYGFQSPDKLRMEQDLAYYYTVE